MDMPAICYRALAALIKRGWTDLVEGARSDWSCGRRVDIADERHPSTYLRRLIASANRAAATRH